MTQGNQFGMKGGRWMTASKLKALCRAGLTLDEIADANERSEGWRPTRSTVSKKLDAIGAPPRRASHHDLLPWHIAPEHSDSLVRHMLQAESRSRQNKTLSATDRKLTARLHEVLFGRGTLMVVDYTPTSGFSFVLREDTDDDVIRKPSKPAMMRKDLRVEAETAEKDHNAAVASGVRNLALRAQDANEDSPSAQQSSR